MLDTYPNLKRNNNPATGASILDFGLIHTMGSRDNPRQDSVNGTDQVQVMNEADSHQNPSRVSK
jgi:hypothetical protein